MSAVPSDLDQPAELADVVNVTSAMLAAAAPLPASSPADSSDSESDSDSSSSDDSSGEDEDASATHTRDSSQILADAMRVLNVTGLSLDGLTGTPGGPPVSHVTSAGASQGSGAGVSASQLPEGAETKVDSGPSRVALPVSEVPSGLSGEASRALQPLLVKLAGVWQRTYAPGEQAEAASRALMTQLQATVVEHQQMAARARLQMGQALTDSVEQLDDALCLLKGGAPGARKVPEWPFSPAGEQQDAVPLASPGDQKQFDAHVRAVVSVCRGLGLDVNADAPTSVLLAQVQAATESRLQQCAHRRRELADLLDKQVALTALLRDADSSDGDHAGSGVGGRASSVVDNNKPEQDHPTTTSTTAPQQDHPSTASVISVAVEVEQKHERVAAWWLPQPVGRDLSSARLASLRDTVQRMQQQVSAVQSKAAQLCAQIRDLVGGCCLSPHTELSALERQVVLGAECLAGAEHFVCGGKVPTTREGTAGPEEEGAEQKQGSSDTAIQQYLAHKRALFHRMVAQHSSGGAGADGAGGCDDGGAGGGDNGGSSEQSADHHKAQTDLASAATDGDGEAGGGVEAGGDGLQAEQAGVLLPEVVVGAVQIEDSTPSFSSPQQPDTTPADAEAHSTPTPLQPVAPQGPTSAQLRELVAVGASAEVATHTLGLPFSFFLLSHAASARLLDRLRHAVWRLTRLREQRKTRLHALAHGITALWRVLEVPEETKRSFLLAHSGLGRRTFEACYGELATLKARKSQLMPSLLQEARNELGDALVDDGLGPAWEQHVWAEVAAEAKKDLETQVGAASQHGKRLCQLIFAPLGSLPEDQAAVSSNDNDNNTQQEQQQQQEQEQQQQQEHSGDGASEVKDGSQVDGERTDVASSGSIVSATAPQDSEEYVTFRTRELRFHQNWERRCRMDSVMKRVQYDPYATRNEEAPLPESQDGKSPLSQDAAPLDSSVQHTRSIDSVSGGGDVLGYSSESVTGAGEEQDSDPTTSSPHTATTHQASARGALMRFAHALEVEKPFILQDAVLTRVQAHIEQAAKRREAREPVGKTLKKRLKLAAERAEVDALKLAKKEDPEPEKNKKKYRALSMQESKLLRKERKYVPLYTRKLIKVINGYQKSFKLPLMHKKGVTLWEHLVELGDISARRKQKKVKYILSAKKVKAGFKARKDSTGHGQDEEVSAEIAADSGPDDLPEEGTHAESKRPAGDGGHGQGASSVAGGHTASQSLDSEDVFLTRTNDPPPSLMSSARGGSSPSAPLARSHNDHLTTTRSKSGGTSTASQQLSPGAESRVQNSTRLILGGGDDSFLEDKVDVTDAGKKKTGRKKRGARKSVGGRSGASKSSGAASGKKSRSAKGGKKKRTTSSSSRIRSPVVRGQKQKSGAGAGAWGKASGGSSKRTDSSAKRPSASSRTQSSGKKRAGAGASGKSGRVRSTKRSVSGTDKTKPASSSVSSPRKKSNSSLSSPRRSAGVSSKKAAARSGSSKRTRGPSSKSTKSRSLSGKSGQSTGSTGGGAAGVKGGSSVASVGAPGGATHDPYATEPPVTTTTNTNTDTRHASPTGKQLRFADEDFLSQPVSQASDDPGSLARLRAALQVTGPLVPTGERNGSPTFSDASLFGRVPPSQAVTLSDGQGTGVSGAGSGGVVRVGGLHVNPDSPSVATTTTTTSTTTTSPSRRSTASGHQRTTSSGSPSQFRVVPGSPVSGKQGPVSWVAERTVTQQPTTLQTPLYYKPAPQSSSSDGDDGGDSGGGVLDNVSGAPLSVPSEQQVSGEVGVVGVVVDESQDNGPSSPSSPSGPSSSTSTTAPGPEAGLQQQAPSPSGGGDRTAHQVQSWSTPAIASSPTSQPPPSSTPYGSQPGRLGGGAATLSSTSRTSSSGGGGRGVQSSVTPAAPSASRVTYGVHTSGASTSGVIGMPSSSVQGGGRYGAGPSSLGRPTGFHPTSTTTTTTTTTSNSNNNINSNNYNNNSSSRSSARMPPSWVVSANGQRPAHSTASRPTSTGIAPLTATDLRRAGIVMGSTQQRSASPDNMPIRGDRMFVWE